MKQDDLRFANAVRNVMEKFSGDAIPGDRSVMRKLFYQKHKGPHTEPYSGGFGEVRRWQQGKPSQQDPEKFDIMEKVDKNPEPVKKPKTK